MLDIFQLESANFGDSYKDKPAIQWLQDKAIVVNTTSGSWKWSWRKGTGDAKGPNWRYVSGYWKQQLKRSQLKNRGIFNLRGQYLAISKRVYRQSTSKLNGPEHIDNNNRSA